MARLPRPILDAAAGNVLVMIAMHQDRPCPTNAEIMEWTGAPRRRLQAFLDDLVARGVIEIEFLDRRHGAGGCGRRACRGRAGPGAATRIDRGQEDARS